MTSISTCQLVGTRFRNVLPIVLLSALLHACGGGGSDTAQTAPVDNSPPSSNPTPPPSGGTPPPTTPSNTAPTISGTAPTSVQAGTPYVFRPTSADAEGDALTFTITNKPAWASFDAATGSLTGTPTAAGTFSGVVITVSDGKATASLAPFAVTVNEAPVVTGNAMISWSPPTERTDGSALSDLAGYRIYYGTQSGNYTKSVTVNTAGVTSYTIEGLTPGTYYFAVTAFDSGGSESAQSTPVSKKIG